MKTDALVGAVQKGDSAGVAALLDEDRSLLTAKRFLSIPPCDSAAETVGQSGENATREGLPSPYRLNERCDPGRTPGAHTGADCAR